MKYNFDLIIERKNTNCLKYDGLKKAFGKEDLIPLWVADMDFRICPRIQQKLIELINHGIFGYPIITEKYYEIIKNWQFNNYKFLIDNQDIFLTTGVISSIKQLINIFSNIGDNILIQSPVYHSFFTIIKQTKRNIIINQLKEFNNKYYIDFDDFRKKIEKSKIFILCNPHNPIGRVWNKEELTKIAEICLENNVLIISDEIHSDFTFTKYKHIPIASIDDELKKIVITCNSPTKSFNLASLNISYIIVQNNILKEKLKSHFCELNTPSIIGLEALYTAYESCSDWLEELKDYIYENYIFLKKFIETEMSCLRISPLEGTYLSWIDFRNLKRDNKSLENLLINKAKIALNPGNIYGPGGEGFQRINLATPRKILFLALCQLKEAIDTDELL